VITYLPFMCRKVFLALFVTLLTSCGNPSNTNPKQILRLNIFTEPPTLDPRKATDSTSVNVLLNLFEGLTRIGEDHQPHPAIAETIAVSEDRRVYTFTLRQAHWSNGEKVTAHDFLYAWQTLLDPHFPSLFAYKLYVIEHAAEIKSGALPMETLGARALDEQTLEVTLKYPTPYFLELAAFPTFYPINRQIDKKNPEWAADAGSDYVSNGPFQLKTWEHESEIVAIKNPHYWDAEVVKLEALHLAMIDDTTTEFYMFEMDELDWAGSPMSNLPPDLIPAFKEEKIKNKLPVTFYPATAVYYYKINTLHPPLENVSIRKALSYAINRKDIVEHVTQAGQTPATALVPPMPGWEKRAPLFKDGDHELAKTLFARGLEELKITREQFPNLTLCYNTNREHEKIAQAIQQQWKETLRIDVELTHCDWKVYLSKITKQDYQIGRMGWVGDFHDPVSFLEPFKFRNDPDSDGNNDTGWEHPDYIAYLDQAEQELDVSKRAELLRKAEALLISEMPIIPIYYIVNGYLKKKYVQDVYLSPLGTADFKKSYIGDPLELK
jgi:oligopeptide transport system substrate-binding protein